MVTGEIAKPTNRHATHLHISPQYRYQLLCGVDAAQCAQPWIVGISAACAWFPTVAPSEITFQHVPSGVRKPHSKGTMSLTTLARRKLLLRSSLARHGSTSPSSSPPSNSAPRIPTSKTKATPTQLPPEKMRALISLYHQSKTFISPSNLSDKIDEVFAKDFYENNASFAGYLTLQNRVKERIAAPVLGDPMTKDQVEPQRWSQGPAARREQMVIDALYGVDGDMPGLDTLLEEESRIRQASKEDEATRESSRERLVRPFHLCFFVPIPGLTLLATVIEYRTLFRRHISLALCLIPTGCGRNLIAPPPCTAVQIFNTHSRVKG